MSWFFSEHNQYALSSLFSESGRQSMSVTLDFELARQCADLAEKMEGEDKKRLMDIADAWLKLASEAAAQEFQNGAGRSN